MSAERSLVLARHRHLKRRAFDCLEALLMVLCGIAIVGFSLAAVCDIVTRTLGRPRLWLQEVTSACFVRGAFMGLAAATRRHDHLTLSMITGSFTGRARQAIETFNRLIVPAVACVLIGFGFENVRHGFGSFRMPSLTPLAWWYLAIPVAGLFVALFTVEQLVNGWRNGFAGEPADGTAREPGR